MVVHGGAGSWRPEHRDRALDGVQRAVDAGHTVLEQGGAALSAVEAAVVVLEDDPIFNAGRGAVLDERGTILHDASLMRGADRAAGAVAAITGIRNPVSAARAVLDEGRHVMLVGDQASRFAREQGLDTEPDDWFHTPERVEQRGNTVGAVALDARGGVAAATSTGGTSRKHPGRVGDSSLIAAGTWADDRTVAISCTGDGEAIIRTALAHEIDALMRHAGLPVAAAAERALAQLGPFGTGGLIAVGADGSVAAPFTTAGMPRAWRIGNHPTIAAIDA
ncbi:isoaspartyl peptidase/L-asparaginase [Solirubrobacter phytolaccae]|uniref:Isoaspartyl peptidase/L-asparaginase n=1 Tax=Solirubrobacter phytolaccae TaxID=1404360 RepID=A0A9X3NI01_9ACTN|nr:isoaspartyl peptidase/L-asparaginase [Solirubrobacter phytolaccae]MDA0185467.1 isoaspartyl peptidase/L-asparaginase [Solirubrobacter phytolaccae]